MTSHNQFNYMTKEQMRDDDDMDRQIRKMREQGLSLTKIGQYVGLSSNTVRRRLLPKIECDNTPRTIKGYDPNDHQDLVNNHRPHTLHRSI